MAWQEFRLIAPEYSETGAGGVAEVLANGELGPTIDITFGPYAGYKVSSGTVYDPATGRAAFFFDPIQENVMMVNDLTSAYFQRESPFSYINSGRSLTAEYGLAGTVNVTLADGTERSVDISVSRTAPAGQRLARYTREDGSIGYVPMDINLTSTELLRELPSFAGWASAEEAARRGALGYLMGELKYGSLSQKAALQQIIDDMRAQSGNQSLDDYEAIAMFLDTASMSDVQAVARGGFARV